MHGTHRSRRRASQQRAARERAQSIPLDDFDVGQSRELFTTDTFWPYFDRLRREDPVHLLQGLDVRAVLVGHQVQRHHGHRDQPSVFSSAASLGGITIRDVRPRPAPRELHRHGPAAPQRRSARRWRRCSRRRISTSLAINIRKRSAECLDNRCPGATTCSTGSTGSRSNSPRRCSPSLFDFPWEDRRKLTRWSDVATTLPGPGGLVATEDERQAELLECATYFAKLWNERIDASRRRATCCR